MMGMGATQDTDMSGYRNHPSQASQYGGPYASVYGSSTLSSVQQVQILIMLLYGRWFDDAILIFLLIVKNHIIADFIIYSND